MKNIALIGNPNSGKSTLFNTLTGSKVRIGNWPGVTVEKKEGRTYKNKDINIVDLPGIYSLSPYTLEEVITRDYLLNQRPDSIINVVDSNNLERNLYLTTQLLDLDIPVVLALNMSDVIGKRGDSINKEKLEKEFGVKAIFTSAITKEGIDELLGSLDALTPSGRFFLGEDIEHSIKNVEDVISVKDSFAKRFYSIKLLERDEKIYDKLKLEEGKLAKIDEIVTRLEKQEDDIVASFISTTRYDRIVDIIKKVGSFKSKEKLSISDRIDKIVTNRFLAIPIFIAIMFSVYYLAISTVGGFFTDWFNNVLFGDIILSALTGLMTSLGVSNIVMSLVIDGVLSGVGAVLGFLPQLLVLFFLLSLLEESGYMVRIAFIMDRMFRRFGLSGKSFIPILISTGCAVPGIMSTRTIESQRDRRLTIITTSFIPCSAKVPVIALISGSIFRGNPFIASSAYFVGIGAIIISGIILKKTKLLQGDLSPFILEMPEYHLPKFKNILVQVYERGKSFIVKAGTTILVSGVIIWFLNSFSFTLEQVVSTEDSMLALIGKGIAVIFYPLGWFDWRATVATLSGFVAKENIVGTFGILFGFKEAPETGTEVCTAVANYFTILSAYSFMIFNLICTPCIAAVSTIKKEMSDLRWTAFAVVYQTSFAYLLALIVYQIGSLIFRGAFEVGTVFAFIVLAILLYGVFRRGKSNKKVISNG